MWRSSSIRCSRPAAAPTKPSAFSKRPGRITFIGLIAAPEGVQALRATHPDVPAYLGAIDSHLNELGYIVPGLGDAGDRQFGTV